MRPSQATDFTPYDLVVTHRLTEVKVRARKPAVEHWALVKDFRK